MTTETEGNIIYITEEHRVEWTYDATKELLKFYDEKCDMLDTGIISTQRKLWDLVAKELRKKGFYYSPAQCENKWKSLKRNYKGKMEKAERFGGSKRACPFEKEITEIISKRPKESIVRSSKSFDRRQEDFDIFNINLNDPPGFCNEDQRDYKFEVIADNENEQQYVVQESGRLIEELVEIKKNMSLNNKAITKNLQQSNEMQSKLVEYLGNCEQNENHQVELYQQRIVQQEEIIKQMKIQNNLLHKLIEKIG